MKQIIFFAILSIAMLSCNNEIKKPEVNLDDKSIFYKETIISHGGDFLGLNLGEDITTASQVLPKEMMEGEEENLLYYNLTKEFTETQYQLIFNNDKLEEIQFDTHVYGKDENYDKNGSLTLFNELKKGFLVKFGDKYMQSSDEENEILYWSNDKKNIQLIHEFKKASIHVYLDIIEL